MSESERIILYVDVPMASFRPRWSREYQDSYPVPPPSTVYGMLLSLIGCDWRHRDRYAGVQLAMALVGIPERSRVLRKFRRVPQSNKDADPLTSRRPDYQELMLWLKFWIIVSDAEANHSLVAILRDALHPGRRHAIRRYGGLCLGESFGLVNEIKRQEKLLGQGYWLINDQNGTLQLPVWVSYPRHVQSGSNGRTLIGAFSLSDNLQLSLDSLRDERYWTRITPTQ